MTLWEAVAWSVIRAAVVGTIVASCAEHLTRRLTSVGVRFPVVKRVWNSILLAAAVIPAMLPGLLVGYAYRPEGLKWVIEPWKADALHGAIAIGRTLPWAMLVAFIVGRGRSGRELLTWRQTRESRDSIEHRLGQTRLWVNDRAGTIAAGLVAGLTTFGEAEIAALLQARGWPEWTFQKLRGGWPVHEIVASLWPVVFVAIAMLLSGWSLRRNREHRGNRASDTVSNGLAGTLIPLLVLAVFVTSFAIPVWRLGGDAVQGAAALTRQTAFWGEVARTVAAACVSAGAAGGLAAWLIAGSRTASKGSRTKLFGRRGGRLLRGSLLFVVAFGVTGPLMVSVVMQSLPGRLLWETVLPQYAGLVVVLLPLATVIAAAARQVGSSRAVLVAGQLATHADRDVRRVALRQTWTRRTGPQVGALGLLYWLAFWDLQTAALLAPPGWATAPGRLYNLAHYGQSEALAAMLVVLSVIAFALPAFALLISYRWTVR